MNQRLQKRAPFRLAAQDYEDLRQRALRRDGWRCQFCGSRHNLEVHHQQFRSHSGEDSEDNLITLCNRCHSAAHGLPKERARCGGPDICLTGNFSARSTKS
jgi:5-methylcytosine-specific restriction endonuclease McrA